MIIVKIKCPDGISWRRTATFERGVYRFTVEADDGLRLYVDDTLLLESWQAGSRRPLELDYPMEPGEHIVRLEYFEDQGVAFVNLRWTQNDYRICGRDLSILNIEEAGSGKNRFDRPNVCAYHVMMTKTLSRRRFSLVERYQADQGTNDENYRSQVRDHRRSTDCAHQNR